ncbi:PREDICTED: melanoma-associated antigen B3-like [Chrysochloris asiatica]|uniref:Melanoma-associated antigen B3-like n=1 Tax=Chrysochloris asiatica TaxID=185453 RepID=A0A9B0TBY1_CHRAS|nr:PREDICTED: melanoma-associated antigen B3-like [Chrysochloris asiatica]
MPLSRRKKTQRAQGDDTKVLRDTQAMETAREEFSFSTPSVSCTTERKPGSTSPQGPQSAPPHPSTSLDTSGTRAYEGGNNKDAKKQNSSQYKPSTMQSYRSPLTKEVSMLVDFLLQMHKMKKTIKKKAMLKLISIKYKPRFLEILQRAAFNIEVVFGTDVKEVDSTKQCYALVSKMNLPNNGMLSRKGFPKTGLLMTVLGVICMKGNCAREEKIWEFLNKMRIYAGKRHFIYGEPRKLITQDFVKLKYLEYRLVPNSDPVSYEFLWGPRAIAETTKMKVLEYLAKINNTDPSAFASWYEEALRDEEERSRDIVRDQVQPTTATASAESKPATPPLCTEL